MINGNIESTHIILFIIQKSVQVAGKPGYRYVIVIYYLLYCSSKIIGLRVVQQPLPAILLLVTQHYSPGANTRNYSVQVQAMAYLTANNNIHI